MKTTVPSLFLAFIGLAFLSSCQEKSVDPSDSTAMPVRFRLQAEGGTTLATPDSLAIHIQVGSGKPLDTTVDWKRHELDLGVLEKGIEVSWRVAAYKWVGTGSIATRRVLWASENLSAKVTETDNSHTAVLATTVSTGDTLEPMLKSSGLVPGQDISLPYKDSIYPISLGFSEAVTVQRNGSPWSPTTDGSYTDTLQLKPGSQVSLKVQAMDSTGNLSIWSWNISRPLVDSTIRLAFIGLDTVVSNSTTTLPVSLRVSSALHLTEIRLNGSTMTRGSDTTLWSGSLNGLLEGNNVVEAIAYGPNKRTESLRETVRRRKALALPAFSLPSGAYIGVQDLTITAPDASLEISEDNKTWTAYSGPISVAASKILYARAFAQGSDTILTSASYEILCAPPSFSVDSGSYATTQSVTVTPGTAGGTAMCSLDSAKTWTACSNPVVINKSIKFMAYTQKTGWTNSTTAQHRYELICSAPTFSVDSGSYTTTQSVTVTPGTAGGTAMCSLDSGTSWAACQNPVAVNKSIRLMAYTQKTGWTNSTTAQHRYELVCSRPTFSVPSRNDSVNQSVTVTPGTAGGTAMCSLDSAKTWAACPSPVTVAKSMKLLAHTTMTGWSTSADTSATYNLTVGKPVINVTVGTYRDTITVASSTLGASFQYSFDNSTWVAFSNRLVLSSSASPLYMRAIIPGWDTSRSQKTITLSNSGTFPDGRDGTAYPWVRIGTQVWMTKNLNYAAPGSTCYGGVASNCDQLGRLYNWPVAMGLDTSYGKKTANLSLPFQGVCPTGWHIPSALELDTLTSVAKLKGNSGFVLRANDTLWKAYPGTDNLGFSALPAGYRYNYTFGITPMTSYSGLDTSAYFLTSTQGSDTAAKAYLITANTLYDTYSFIMTLVDKLWGYSLRCLAN